MRQPEGGHGPHEGQPADGHGQGEGRRGRSPCGEASPPTAAVTTRPTGSIAVDMPNHDPSDGPRVTTSAASPTPSRRLARVLCSIRLGVELVVTENRRRDDVSPRLVGLGAVRGSRHAGLYHDSLS